MTRPRPRRVYHFLLPGSGGRVALCGLSNHEFMAAVTSPGEHGRYPEGRVCMTCHRVLNPNNPDRDVRLWEPAEAAA